MIKFELTIFKPSSLIYELIFSGILIGLIVGIPLFNKSSYNIFSSFICFISSMVISVYAGKNTLYATFNNDRIIYKWKPKALFNHKPIEDLILTEITILVIDNGNLTKIITEKGDHIINYNKFKDADNYKNFLLNYTNAKILDSWDLWKMKGYLKYTYYLTLMMVLGGSAITLLFIHKKGFNYKIFYMFGSLSPMIIYLLNMRDKLRK